MFIRAWPFLNTPYIIYWLKGESEGFGKEVSPFPWYSLTRIIFVLGIPVIFNLLVHGRGEMLALGYFYS